MRHLLSSWNFLCTSFLRIRLIHLVVFYQGGPHAHNILSWDDLAFLFASSIVIDLLYQRELYLFKNMGLFVDQIIRAALLFKVIGAWPLLLGWQMRVLFSVGTVSGTGAACHLAAEAVGWVARCVGVGRLD